MKQWLRKWIPIFFGCHQKPERSLFIKGKQLPICARCTGELIGILIAVIGFAWIKNIPIIILVLMMIPMIADGITQALTKYESNNTKRLITGILFGIGIVTLFFMSVIYVYELGRECGKIMLAK